jgi:hypothetical protein
MCPLAKRLRPSLVSPQASVAKRRPLSDPNPLNGRCAQRSYPSSGFPAHAENRTPGNTPSRLQKNYLQAMGTLRATIAA